MALHVLFALPVTETVDPPFIPNQCAFGGWRPQQGAMMSASLAERGGTVVPVSPAWVVGYFDFR